jgi:hypothetical protein
MGSRDDTSPTMNTIGVKMSDWKRIDNAKALETFLYEVDGFHDALVHEAIILNTGYVDEKGWMHGDVDLPNARIVIQSQVKDVIGVELELKRVTIFSLKFAIRLQLEGEILEDGVVLYPCGKRPANNLQLRAKEIGYRMLGMESRGPRYRLSSGVESEFITDEEEPRDYPGAG